jgi:hypothetical protein
MSLKNNIQELQHLIGRECWGILQFELDIEQFTKVLSIDEWGISIDTLKQWVVFPELIPPDILQLFHKKLTSFRNKLEENTLYCSEYENDMLSSHHTFTLELLRLKYCADVSEPSSFDKIYSLNSEAFKMLCDLLVEHGYQNYNTLSEFIFFYYKKNGGKECHPKSN